MLDAHRFAEGGHVFTRQVAILISCPPDEVFAYVGDVRNRPSWDESVDSEELTSPEPIGVGSTVRTRFRSMGKDYEYTWKIVEHEAPSRQTVESTSGPFPTTLVRELSARDGGTWVEFSVTGRPRGLLRLPAGRSPGSPFDVYDARRSGLRKATWVRPRKEGHGGRIRDHRLG